MSLVFIKKWIKNWRKNWWPFCQIEKKTGEKTDKKLGIDRTGLIDAAGSLSLKSYQRFKMRVGRLNEYCCEFLEDDTAKVFSKKFVTDPDRFLRTGHTDGIYRCRSCEASIASS